MTESLNDALAEIRSLLDDADRLVRVVASGRQRAQHPSHVKVEARPVSIKGQARLQVVRFDTARPHTENVPLSQTAAVWDALLAEPYGHWRVELVDSTVQLRVTKRGKAQMHRGNANRSRDLNHDRVAGHLIAADDPLFRVLDAGAAKRRQVDAFLRATAGLLGDSPANPHVVDLGCGNAYLTFAMYRYLTANGANARVTGVDVRDDQRRRNCRLAAELGWDGPVSFRAGKITDTELDKPHLVLALHACDTATDEALARGMALGAKHIVAAPCCHHDIAAQLRHARSPFPAMTCDGVLRERFADVLTDSLRALLLRLHGYRVDVIEFIDSVHTPRNTMLRATYTGAPADAARHAEYQELVETWQVRPYLEELLAKDQESQDRA